jgi:hypothetical protein
MANHSKPVVFKTRMRESRLHSERSSVKNSRPADVNPESNSSCPQQTRQPPAVLGDPSS